MKLGAKQLTMKRNPNYRMPPRVKEQVRHCEAAAQQLGIFKVSINNAISRSKNPPPQNHGSQ
jgi:hypothetical protein